ncbi:NADPH-dependent aldehyde reductase-like protein, chloroplastic [Rutidosis leptorrhynchoides]|uniref:NADPH-dependent aldehyde reductase-like protein, chloroplastic n=1 Tax=Rutidosis leptorrhynchoides TaxID=125765 RepID=UPI003A99097D
MAAVTPPQTVESPPLPLHGRVAIVTGGSRGIGKAIALHLASLGAKLVINYNFNSTLADRVVSEINSNSNELRAVSIKADVSNEIQVKSLFDATESAFNSPLYVVVNAAGVLDSSYSTTMNSSTEQFNKTINVNTRGAYLICKEAAKRVKRDGGGRIICLTSSMVVALRPGYGAYAASKAAVEAMVKILAKELKGTRITANCVAPGPVASDMFFEGKSEEMVNRAIVENPFGRLGVPEDVAPLVGFLAGDSGEWVNGQVVRVNGGYV